MHHPTPSFLFLAALGACGGPREVTPIQGEFAVGPDVVTLAIEVEHGSITVLPGAEGQPLRFEGEILRVAGDRAALGVLQALDLGLRPAPEAPAGTLLLTVPKLPAGQDPETARIVLRAVLHAPPRLRVTVRTGVGHVKIVGAEGGCDAEVAFGDVAIQRCHGLARARATHGNVLVDGHDGGVDVEAAGGMLQVFVTRLAAPGVRAVGRDPIAVHLPRGAGFELDALAERNKCVNGFGLPVAGEGAGERMRGAANGGGPAVHVRAAFGRISVAAGD